MITQDDDRNKVPFAPEWFSAMVEIGFFALRDWLELSKAPREVIDLLDEIVLLSQFQGELSVTGNSLSADHLDILSQSLMKMTENAARLGATFSSAVGASHAREPLKWQSPDLTNRDALMVLGIHKNEN